MVCDWMFPLSIEESWREYKKIPSLFQEMAEEPEGFFSLESQSLRDLVKTALEDNPELKEAEAAWKASLKKARVVSALPEPNLAATAFLESVETRVCPQEAVLILTQKLPRSSRQYQSPHPVSQAAGGRGLRMKPGN